MHEFLSGFNFIDFDFTAEGKLRDKLAEAAKAAGVKPVDILRQALGAQLGEIAEGDLQSNGVINQGNGGFHIVTLVADGYGAVVAEDSRGAELARTNMEWDQEADPSGVNPLQEAVRRFVVNADHGTALEKTSKN